MLCFFFILLFFLAKLCQRSIYMTDSCKLLFTSTLLCSILDTAIAYVDNMKFLYMYTSSFCSLFPFVTWIVNSIMYLTVNPENRNHSPRASKSLLTTNEVFLSDLCCLLSDITQWRNKARVHSMTLMQRSLKVKLKFRRNI